MDKNIRRRIKELEEEMEALVIAIPKEEASYHFYLDLANHTEHEGARTMFKHLAEEELQHKSGLVAQVQRLKTEIETLKQT